MNFIEVKGRLNGPLDSKNSAFDILKSISLIANEPDSEEAGRELVLRALDKRGQFGAMSSVLDALARQVGLFPYLEPETLNARDRIAYEFHRPDGDDDKLVFHRAQAEVYRRLMEGENVILSAPTSFGKSKIIDAMIASNKYSNIAIIVPTIALIDETRRRLSAFSDSYKIITQLAQKPGSKNIFILTAERAVGYEELPIIDFFVIDEFYKIGAFAEDPSRTIALNHAFYRLYKGGGQFYLLGPNIRKIPDGLEAQFRCVFISTNFSTVACDIIPVLDWEEEIPRLVELAADLDEPTLIFCKSPTRVNEVAKAFISQGIGSDATDLQTAADWIGDKFHTDWIFGKALTSGIGLHHGRLPRSLAQFAVRMFNQDKLRFLICTSTLIEGVNTKAKNVIILDNVIAKKKYDFFTFNNIKGRSGRMFEHFVGSVYLFNQPPAEELPFVDFPIYTQDAKTPDSLLVQIEDTDLSSASRLRLSGIREQDVLPLGLIRQNAGLDPQSQVDFAERLDAMNESLCGQFMWNQIPQWAQLKATNELIWEYFVKKGHAGVFSGAQLTLKIWSLFSERNFKTRVNLELRPGRYAAKDVDDAVERVLSFDRNWAGFEFPRLLCAASRIQEYIFDRRFGQSGEYTFFASQVEHLFRKSAIVTLEEYGLPLSISDRINRVLGLSDDLDTALSQVKAASPVRCGLDPFESELLEEVQRTL